MIKICGIYKITSPSGRIYIGQAKNLRKRLNSYKGLHCKGQTKLYNSLKKYGWENHQFDIIEYCLEEELNCSERFWQDEFDVMSQNGLNCILQECGENRGVYSEIVRKNMSISNHYRGTRGKVKNSIKVIDIITGIEYSSIREAAFMLGVHHKGLSDKLKGTVDNTSNLIYLDEYLKGNKIIRKESKKAIKVIDEKTGVIYKTIKEAAAINNIYKETLREYLTGIYKNKTNLRIYKQ